MTKLITQQLLINILNESTNSLSAILSYTTPDITATQQILGAITQVVHKLTFVTLKGQAFKKALS